MSETNPPLSSIKTSVYIPKSNHDLLGDVAAHRGITVAEVIREAIAQYIGRLVIHVRP